MSEFSLMILEEGFAKGIRCRFISEWFKIDFYASGTERLLLGIERDNPDVVVMDLELYGRIDGTETSIRSRFGVPLMYA